MENKDTSRDTSKVLRLGTLFTSFIAICMSALSLHVSYDTLQRIPSAGGDVAQTAVTSEAVRAALMRQPSMLVDAGRALQAMQDETDHQATIPLVDAVKGELFAADVPFFGNPNGKHVVAEFFDYQCEYCRGAEPVLEKAIAQDPELKIQLREIVIINEGSIPASLAALASRAQGKYEQVHKVLMSLQVPFTEEKVMSAIAAVPGINMDRLRADMASQSIRDALTQNVSLSRRIGVAATPSFAVAGNGIQKGFRDLNTFQSFVERKSSN